MNRNYYSFFSNSFLEDDDSNDDYPIKFIKNPYLMEHSTNLQSILFDRALDKKDEKKQLYEFNNMNILESEQKQDENINILITDNKHKDKPKKILGRHRKNDSSNNIGKHTGNSPDNIFKKATRYCIKNTYVYLQKEIKLYAKSKKVRIRKLHVPTILKYLDKGNFEKCLLFDSSLKTLFIDMIPKRVKKSIENDRTKYSHNKDILNKILKIEENDKELKEKKLSIKFNAQFKIYFKCFLDSEKPYFVDENDENYNKFFKTIKNFYDEKNNNFTDKEIKEFEKYLNKFMNKTLQFRKKKKKNS